MRLLLSLATLTLGITCFTSCKSGADAPAAVCDSVCLSDSVKFVKAEHSLQPYVSLSVKDCKADTLSWGYKGSGATSLSFSSFMEGNMQLNPAAIGCYIRDTSYAWLYFNDCATGQGFMVKLPYNKGHSLSRMTSAITSFDPKFHVDESLVAYSDRGNLFAEEKATGKKATLTFGKRLEIDYAAIHDYIDSVHITPTRMWAKVKIDNEWKELERNIELK
ncbi:MAG TPA: hypothetical protein PKC69_08720 [Chitinophagaceae bacterium]|nr:hypothetical protein [Chitinophagaceae bacterium]